VLASPHLPRRQATSFILVASKLSRTSHVLSPGARARKLWIRAVDRRLSAICAPTAGVASLSLLAILVYVADEHPPVYAGVGTQALKT